MTTENETPSWLNDDAPAPAPAAAAAPAPAPPAGGSKLVAAAPVPASAGAASLDTPDVATGSSAADATVHAALEEEQMKGIILYTRMVNFAASISVLTMSVLYVIGASGRLDVIVLSLYSTCGGCLICCTETQLKFVRTSIAMNFGFLFHAGFRFMFYLLVASVCLGFRSLFGYINGAVLIAVAFYNTYILMSYPAYRQMREKLAAEEDQRIEGRMREQMRKEATRQMFAKN